jgi:hypothetical protein
VMLSTLRGYPHNMNPDPRPTAGFLFVASNDRVLLLATRVKARMR